VGMLMDIFSAIVVVVPLVLPVARQLGVNDYHLGIVFLLNLEIGYLTPPVGLNLFISSFRFGKPVTVLYKAVLPFIALLLVALAVTTYIPSLSLMFLPEGAGDNVPSSQTTPDPIEPLPDAPIEPPPSGGLDDLEGLLDEGGDLEGGGGLDALEQELEGGGGGLDALEQELNGTGGGLDALEQELNGAGQEPAAGGLDALERELAE